MNRFYSCFRTAFLFAFCLAVSSTLQAANYNYNIGSQTLGITLGTDESLTVTVSGPNIVFTLSAGTFSQTGPNGATGGGTGTITVPASNVASSLTVNNTGVPAGTNNVTFSGSSSINTGTLAIDLSGNGVGTVAFTGGFDVSVSTAMNIATNRNISVTNGSQLTATGTAPILLEANQQATPTSGGFIGIELTGATVQSTGSGALTLSGRGGDSGSNQVGVKLSSAAQINGSSGTVTVMGTGGAGTNSGNDGVFVQDAQISSTGGDVFVTGQGGNVSSAFSQGIYLQTGSEITAGGSGTVTVTGTGGAGPNNSYNGVFMIDGRISSSGGDVLVIGQGGNGPAGFNEGVTVRNGSDITAGGSGTVTVTGTGGTGAGPSNYGVFVAFFNSRITSSGGDVLVTGTGGGTGVSADNYGVYLLDESEITAEGSGTVTVTGTGSASTGSNNYGVFVKDPNTMISSSDGGVLVTGTGSNGAADITMQAGGAITSTSTSASITLNSTTNGTWPNTNGTDVSTVSPQKTAFSAGSKLNIDIDGTTPNTDYQQLGVGGMIDLTGVELTFNGSTHAPSIGETFVIVDNDGVDAIIGTFDGLLEGDFISNFLGSGLDALITYVGGDGNDVVLTIIANCNINITNVTVTDEGCPGANDGTLTVTATCASCAGGNADIRYSIDNIDFSNTTGVFTGLADGDYTVYVRDVNDIGCTDSDGPHTIAAGVDNEAPVPDVVVGGGWEEAAKALASDAAAGDSFGFSVSISGDYAIVGAVGEDAGGSNAGAAYIFKRSGASWVEEAKLQASDAEADDNFGNSVWISGDYAIVGARFEDTGGNNAGAAYIFKRSGTSWAQEAKLQASDAEADDNFGNSVSIHGDYAIVGAQREDTGGIDAGAAYIFKRSGTSWPEEAKIQASDAEAADGFGSSVSIHGDYVIVGAPLEGTGGLAAGAAYIFKRSGTSWAQEAKIQASDAEISDVFGSSVSISGEYAIVGAQGEDTGGSSAGAAYIFKRSGTSWTEEAKILASDAETNDLFGNSVLIRGDYAIVGAFGEDTGGTNVGAAYIFKRSGTAWIEEAKIQASDAEEFDQFGNSVSISEDYVIVGAFGEDTGGNSAGAAYLFELQPGDLPAFTAECSATPPTPTATDNCAGTINGTTTTTFPITTPGTTTITWTYDDGNGNITTQDQDIILDNSNCCDINITNVAVTDEGCPGANDGTLMVTATCASCAGGNADIRYSIDNIDFSNTTGVFTGLADGDYTVYVRDVNDIGCTDSDGPHTVAAGVDNQPPSIVCPSDMTVDNDPGLCVANVTYMTPLGIDNCANPMTTQIQGIESGHDFPVGTTTNVFQVVDASGNMASCEFDVTVVDTEPPMFTFCPTTIEQDNDAGSCDAVVTFSPPTATDNCTIGVQGELATNYNTNNGQRGVMFDITATNTVNVTHFDANLYDATTANYEIYYKAGTYQGSENNAGDWIFVGQATGVTSLGVNVPTPLPIPVNVTIPAGQTYGFYITNDFGGGTAYTDGVSPNTTLATNSDMLISGGVGKAYPFGLNFNYRYFNGTVHYGSALSIVQDQGLPSGSTFPVGTTNINFVATDGYGNTADCSFDVIVNDNEDPVAVCPTIAPTVVLDGSGNGTLAENALAGGNSTDNCAGVIETSPLTNFTCADAPSAMVILTATDAAGNMNTANCTVNIDDSNCCDISITNVTVTDEVCPGANDGTLTVTATCASCAGGNADIRYSIDNIDFSNTTGVFTGLADGDYTVYVRDVNDIGCTDSDGPHTIAVGVDNEAPVITCPANITVQQTSPAGAVVTFADATATDNCSATVMQTAGAASGSTFAVGIHTITFEATDPSLNTVSCSFTIEVTPLYELSGTIRWEHDNAGVEAATVDLTGDATDNTLTNVDGEYDFEVAPGSYTLTPSKTDGLLNGVSVADVLAIQQHVTFVNPITDPYKLIAADVNQSSSISTLDALIVSQTILGNPVAEALFLNSWRFVDADYVFPNPASPWSFPSSISLVDVEENTPAQDFVAVKMGDVNGSAMPNSNFWDDSWANRNDEAPVLVWQVDDQPLHTIGEELELMFKAGDLNDLIAYQFGLGFSRSHLELLEVIPHEALGLELSHFGTHMADAGELRGLWWEEQEGLSHSLAPGTPVFTLRFRVLRRADKLSDYLWLDETILKDEAYRTDRMRGRVVLEFAEQVVSASDAASSGQIKLYQNVPNPFDEVTRIGFELPEATDVKLRIMDVSGREIQLIEGRFAAGYNEVEVRNLPARGLFFYQLQTEGFTATLKMVRE